MLFRSDVSEFLTDLNDVFHRSSEDDDFTSASDRGFDDLTRTIDVGGESRHDHPSLRLTCDRQKGCGDFLLGNREAADTGVGRIAHQQGDADLTDIRHDLVIGIGSDRSQVELEIAGFDDSSVRGVDQNTQAVRYGVDGIKESHFEMFRFDPGRIVDQFDFDLALHPSLFQFTVEIGRASWRGKVFI